MSAITTGLLLSNYRLEDTGKTDTSHESKKIIALARNFSMFRALLNVNTYWILYYGKEKIETTSPALHLLAALKDLEAVNKAAEIGAIGASAQQWLDEAKLPQLAGSITTIQYTDDGRAFSLKGNPANQAVNVMVEIARNIAVLETPCADAATTAKQRVINFMFKQPALFSACMNDKDFLTALGCVADPETDTLPGYTLDLQGVPFHPSEGIEPTLRELDIPHVHIKTSGVVDGITFVATPKKPLCIGGIFSDSDVIFKNCGFGIGIEIGTVKAENGTIQFGAGCTFGGVIKGMAKILNIDAENVVYGESDPENMVHPVIFSRLSVGTIRAKNLFLSPCADYTGKKRDTLFGNGTTTTPAIPDLNGVETLSGLGTFFDVAQRPITKESGRTVVGEPEVTRGAVFLTPRTLLWLGGEEPTSPMPADACIKEIIGDAGRITHSYVTRLKDAQRLERKLVANANAFSVLDAAMNAITTADIHGAIAEEICVSGDEQLQKICSYYSFTKANIDSLRAVNTLPAAVTVVRSDVQGPLIPVGAGELAPDGKVAA